MRDSIKETTTWGRWVTSDHLLWNMQNFACLLNSIISFLCLPLSTQLSPTHDWILFVFLVLLTTTRTLCTSAHSAVTPPSSSDTWLSRSWKHSSWINIHTALIIQHICTVPCCLQPFKTKHLKDLPNLDFKKKKHPNKSDLVLRKACKW